MTARIIGTGSYKLSINSRAGTVSFGSFCWEFVVCVNPHILSLVYIPSYSAYIYLLKSN